MAIDRGYKSLAAKSESYEICFIPDQDYKKFITMRSPTTPGNFIDKKGGILGKHPGIHYFTIGQRKGIGIAHKEPLYVININAKKNEVIVGNREALAIKRIFVKDINLLSKFEDYNGNLFIKVRSTGRLIKAKANLNNTSAQVNLEELETGISPGQACVFYLGDQLLGGGWIAK